MAKSIIAEEWKPVVGYEGLYEVSSFGQVRSLRRTCKASRGIGAIRPVPEKIMTQVLRKGYPGTSLCRNGKHKIVRIHKLVLEAFVGPCPRGMNGAHDDGNPLNCRASNLRWDTQEGNCADKHRHGTAMIGERNPLAKLTVARVLDIRSSKESSLVLSRKHGVSWTTIKNVRARKIWKHV